MKRILTLVMIVLCIASGSAIATAQESTPTTTPTPTQTPSPEPQNQTAPPGAPDDLDLVVDRQVALVDWDYRDGEFVLDVYASDYTTMTVAASPSTRSQSGSVNFESVVLEKETTTTVRIPASRAITFWTENSVEDGRAYFLRKKGDLITGPYSGDDVRNAAIGGAFGVVIAVLYEAVSAKVGAAERGERLA